MEVYGNLNDFTTNFEAGLSYVIHDYLQLDISTGWQEDDMVDDWFLYFGVSWRVHWKD